MTLTDVCTYYLQGDPELGNFLKSGAQEGTLGSLCKAFISPQNQCFPRETLVFVFLRHGIELWNCPQTVPNAYTYKTC